MNNYPELCPICGQENCTSMECYYTIKAGETYTASIKQVSYEDWLKNNQQDLDPEFNDIVNKEFWNII